jgi:hypothetical protein
LSGEGLALSKHHKFGERRSVAKPNFAKAPSPGKAAIRRIKPANHAVAIIYIDRVIFAPRDLVPVHFLSMSLNLKRLHCRNVKKIEQETSKNGQKFEYLTLLNSL